MKTTKKSTSRWSVIWKTLAAVLMLLFIVLGCIRLYYVISSWHYHRTDGFTQSLSDEPNVEVMYRYYYHDYRVYDVETGDVELRSFSSFLFSTAISCLISLTLPLSSNRIL